MERITSSAIQSLADYGDSDDEISEQTVEVDDRGTVHMERVVIRPSHSVEKDKEETTGWFLLDENSLAVECDLVKGENDRIADESPGYSSHESVSLTFQGSTGSLVNYSMDAETTFNTESPSTTAKNKASSSLIDGNNQCDPDLEKKFDLLFAQKMRGFNFNQVVQQRSDFRNPSIYQKLVEHFEIDELGTNFPKQIFDPHGFRDCDYYDELAKAQNVLMAKLKRDKKLPDDLSQSTRPSVADKPQRKSKWSDAGEPREKHGVKSTAHQRK